MVRYPHLEALGLSLACVTEASDGDFARSSGRPEGDVFYLAGLDRREVFTLEQVHGTYVQVVGGECGDAPGEGDGLATQDASIAIGVRVADCVPVLLYDPANAAIAVVHAGRKGTFDRITLQAIQVMKQRFKAVPGAIYAVIGPSAGPCCYEVSEDLAEAFRDRGYPVEGRHVDLWRANSQQLELAGVERSRIYLDGTCTICSGRFHSHRATGTPARNLAVLALSGGQKPQFT